MPRQRISGAQKKFAGTGMHFYVNLDSLIQTLGAGEAMTEMIKKDKRYLDAILDESFEKADHKFNVEAAAYGTTGAISHMYEWGTVGINKGRSNMRLNPMNPGARLWHTFNQGAGLNRTLWFAYRPSLSNVPKPTVAATGMSSEVIKKMRDHVFKWKAEVMEEAHDVTIAPRKAKFLLIPAYEENRPYMRPHDIKRGYSLTKGPINANPGYAKKAGNFTKFWLTFWEGQAAILFDADLKKQIESDFTPELTKPRTASTVRPVGTMMIRNDIKAASKKTKKRVQSKAQLRRLQK